MKRYFRRFYIEDKGQSLVEYALIISIVVLGVFVLVGTVGQDLSLFYNTEIVNKFP